MCRSRERRVLSTVARVPASDHSWVCLDLGTRSLLLNTSLLCCSTFCSEECGNLIMLCVGVEREGYFLQRVEFQHWTILTPNWVILVLGTAYKALLFTCAPSCPYCVECTCSSASLCQELLDLYFPMCNIFLPVPYHITACILTFQIHCLRIIDVHLPARIV